MEQSQMIPPQQPSVEELRREMEESMVRAGLREDPAKVEDPTLTFWQKLVTTSGGKSRASEMARSAARGATGAVKELQETAAAHGNPIIATGAKLGAKITSKVQSLFGEQSDDPVSAFTESAVQFIAPFAAGGALGLESKMGMVAGGAARGAAVDLTAFDAQAGNIGDLLAKIPDRGAFSGAAKAFGELLTVEDDDSEAVGKAKNAAAGIIPGVVLDGVVALSRFKRARKAGDVAGAEANATILKNIAEGTHVPEGAHVKVAPNEDGTFRIEPTQVDGPLAAEADDVVPKFPTREAAEAQAETINFAMNEQLKAVANAGGLTEGQANEVRRVLQRMLTSPGPVDMQKLLEGTDFNFSYMNEPKETLAMIEAISEVFEKELKAARSTEGISHERQIELANEILGSVHPDQIPGVMAQVVGKGTTASLPARLLAANFALREVARKAAKLFDIVEARPNDTVAMEQARLVAKNMLELQEAMASASSNTGRALEIHKAFDEMAEAGGPKAGAPKVKPTTKPSFDSPKAKALNGDGKGKLDPIAGMDRRQILTVLRMAKMAGGEPRNLFAVGHAVKPLRETGNISAALEVFINALLSSPKVVMTALASGAVESTMRAAGKIVGGAATLNGSLAREGIDIIYGNLRYFADNFKAAQASLRAGRSIINPVAPHEAISGRAGAVIRTPSKLLGAADEFTRVTNYRSYVRAKSLRVWREKGLTGQGLLDQVEKDLAAAFDAETGIATIPAALKYAEGPTLSAPLAGNLGQGLTKLVETVPALRFIVPFLRTGVNAFNANLDRTPLINLLVKRNREIFKKGGEEAAELAAQTAIAGSVYAYAFLRAKAGELTGRGPSDPGLRKLWLKDHQPYSIKIGDKWVNYRRLDPTLTPLGLVADGMMIAEEQERRGAKGADFSNIAAASIAALARSLTSPTYMRGLNEFLSAWSSGNGWEAERWYRSMATAVTAPSIVNYFNDDPYYREVDGLIEATMARYPGLSEKLPARYDVFGEPEMRFPSKSIFPTRSAKADVVAQEIVQIGKALPSMAQVIEEGAIDLGDREKFGENGVSPWERMNELLREPKYGRPSLKDRLETLVTSDKWENASAGSMAYPGGERYTLASRIVDAYQRAALLQTIKEFPKLKEEIRLVRKIQGKAFSDGQEGVEELLRTLGK